MAAREPGSLLLEEKAAAAFGTKQQFHQAGFSFSSGNWIYTVFTKFLCIISWETQKVTFWLTGFDLTGVFANEGT